MRSLNLFNKERKPRKVHDTPMYWSYTEHQLWVDALKTYGKDFVQIAAAVGTKSEHKCRVRAFNMQVKLTKQGTAISSQNAQLLKILQERKRHERFDDIVIKLEDGTTEEQKVKKSTGYGKWTSSEIAQWKEYLREYGKQHKVIARLMGNKDARQCECRARKLRLRLEEEGGDEELLQILQSRVNMTKNWSIKEQ